MVSNHNHRQGIVISNNRAAGGLSVCVCVMVVRVPLPMANRLIAVGAVGHGLFACRIDTG